MSISHKQISMCRANRAIATETDDVITKLISQQAQETEPSNPHLFFLIRLEAVIFFISSAYRDQYWDSIMVVGFRLHFSIQPGVSTRTMNRRPPFRDVHTAWLRNQRHCRTSIKGQTPATIVLSASAALDIRNIYAAQFLVLTQLDFGNFADPMVFLNTYRTRKTREKSHFNWL